MQLEVASFGFGFSIAAGMAWCWLIGWNAGIRHSRRIWRHGRNLDQVFFEDAERDPTIETPKPHRGDVHPIASRLP